MAFEMLPWVLAEDPWYVAAYSEPHRLVDEISRLTAMSVFGRMEFDMDSVHQILYIDFEEFERFVEGVLKPCRDLLRFLVRTIYEGNEHQISHTSWAVIQGILLNLFDKMTEKLALFKRHWLSAWQRRCH